MTNSADSVPNVLKTVHIEADVREAGRPSRGEELAMVVRL
jgi:hypothetical protein